MIVQPQPQRQPQPTSQPVQPELQVIIKKEIIYMPAPEPVVIYKAVEVPVEQPRSLPSAPNMFCGSAWFRTVPGSWACR